MEWHTGPAHTGLETKQTYRHGAENFTSTEEERGEEERRGI